MPTPLRCRSLSESYPSSGPAPAALERSRTVADLLQHPDFDRGSWPVDGFSQFLISAARLHFHGNFSRFAGALGLSKATLHGWAHDGMRPTFHRVVALAEVFGCSIRSVLVGDVPQTEMRATPSLRSRRHRARAIPPEIRKHIPRKLHTFQQRSKPISLAQAARELGVSSCYLRIHYPIECDAIVASFKRRRVAEAREHKDRLMAAFRSKVTAMAASGTKLSLKHVMGKPPTGLIRLRRECHQIIADIVGDGARKGGPD